MPQEANERVVAGRALRVRLAMVAVAVAVLEPVPVLHLALDLALVLVPVLAHQCLRRLLHLDPAWPRPLLEKARHLVAVASAPAMQPGPMASRAQLLLWHLLAHL